MTLRSLGLLATAQLAISIAGCAHFERTSAPSDALAIVRTPSPEQRYWLLRDEVAELAGKHPWAGHYKSVDVDTADEFLVAPTHGWVRLRHGIGAPRFVGAGSIEVVADRLRLSDDGQVSNAAAVPELLPVRWDRRRYLLFPYGIASFLNDVNAGREQRKAIRSRLVWGGDTYAQGRPELPPEFAKSVLEPPLVARVSRVEPCPPIDEGVNASVELDVGSDHGAYVGMLLYPRLEGSAAGWVSVTNTTPRSCKARCEGFTTITPLEPGTTFSSAPPERWAEQR
jgi:hypothetical protein